MKNIVRGSNIVTNEFESEEIWLLTDNEGKSKPVQDWTTEGNDTLVYFKMNASLFNGTEVLGRNVGFKENLDYVEGRPNQKDGLTRYDLVIYKDKSYAWGLFASYDRVQTDITCGYSVAMIVVADGEDVNLYSTYLGKNSTSIHSVNTYVGLIKTTDGRWIGFNAQNNSPSDLRTYFKTIYDVEFICMNDGGGSTQTVYYDDNGNKVVLDYDGENRSVVNIIAGVIDNRNVATEENSGTDEEVEEKTTEIIKRKFGMRTLNITQGRFEPNGVSHQELNAYDLGGEDSGIDKFTAFYPYEVIGVWEYSATGFSNTIMFYDSENDITLALTHMNAIDTSIWYVGKVFSIDEIMYYEGTKGNATGNHIHLEVAKGKQTSKVYKETGGYQLEDLLNIEDYFYLEEGFHVVIDDGGYDFEWIVVPTDDEVVEEVPSVDEPLIEEGTSNDGESLMEDEIIQDEEKEEIDESEETPQSNVEDDEGDSDEVEDEFVEDEQIDNEIISENKGIWQLIIELLSAIIEKIKEFI